MKNSKQAGRYTTFLKFLIAPVSLLFLGLFLTASGLDMGLPPAYWDAPRASSQSPPSQWSELERDLRPEACAQCHAEQFDAWKQSLHAQAFSPGLVGQFAQMSVADANACLNCHAPLLEQHFSLHQEEKRASIALLLKHPQGFSTDGDLDRLHLPLRHTGVSCASCHVRGWKRFGPPQRQTRAVGRVSGPAHDGFMATRDFETSRFCASCHQFPQSMAINGKPLENTFEEWKASRFAAEGIHCQNCHMPERRHEFRGIHDPEMSRRGLRFDTRLEEGQAVLRLASVWVGHAFPTYVTPKIVIRAEAMDAKGDVLRAWQWEIHREVEFVDGAWHERKDSRLLPGEIRTYVARPLPEAAKTVRYRVKVMPDHFYKSVYASLLRGGLGDAPAEALIRQADQRARNNDYMLFERELALR